METWEHATLGWYLDGRRAIHFWRVAGSEPERLDGADGMLARMGVIGSQGWEMVTATSSELNGETLYFKRRSSE